MDNVEVAIKMLQAKVDVVDFAPMVDASARPAIAYEVKHYLQLGGMSLERRNNVNSALSAR